jgi:Flp pilus assembly protein TadB
VSNQAKTPAPLSESRGAGLLLSSLGNVLVFTVMLAFVGDDIDGWTAGDMTVWAGACAVAALVTCGFVRQVGRTRRHSRFASGLALGLGLALAIDFFLFASLAVSGISDT